jgi:hypothetical protein
MTNEHDSELNKGLSLCCCERTPDEQLFGTAPRAKIWFILEYRASFGAEALSQSTISKRVQDHLESVPQSRVQLINKPEIERVGDLAFFVALPDQRNPVMYAFTLASYDALLMLDLQAIVAGDPKYAANRVSDPLLLVCVNGKRDISCAKYGLPVYNIAKEALTSWDDEQIWQTTHLGGHRFAGTAIVLPHGISYGRLSANNVRYVLDEYRAGRIALEVYRGATFYGEVEQVAEFYLRAESGLREFEAFRLIHTEQEHPEAWRVDFTDLHGRIHEMRIARDSHIETYKNSSDTSAVSVPQFRLLSHLIH